MPRKRREFERPRRTIGNLVERLVDELESNRESGQPLIDEEEFPTKKLRVNVVWDDWDRVPMEDRTATILRAYELAEGEGSRNRIALASGLTVPEAHAAGMLPFQVIVVRHRPTCRVGHGQRTRFTPGWRRLVTPWRRGVKPNPDGWPR